MGMTKDKWKCVGISNLSQQILDLKRNVYKITWEAKGR